MKKLDFNILDKVNINIISNYNKILKFSLKNSLI